MGHTSRFEADAARILADAEAAAAVRARRPVRTRALQWISALTRMALLMVVVLPLLRTGDLRELNPQGPMFWANIAAAVAIAALNLLFSDRTVAKVDSNPAAFAERQQREIDRFTTDGWESRTLLLGVKLGLGVGVPVGLLLILLPLDIFDNAPDRATGFVGFVGLTFLWAIPAGFGIRWLWLRQAKRHRKEE